jgi:ribosomal protein S18 acetylase RimI-like enzyme
MLNRASALPSGLSLRPARPADHPFLISLYADARPELQWIEGGADLVQSVVALQYRVFQEGAGHHYPNAMHFIVEKTAACIGALIVDFGHAEVRILYIAFITEARGLGYGRYVLQGVQQAARKVRCPVAVTVSHINARAKQLYLELGFRVEETQVACERLVWYPSTC